MNTDSKKIIHMTKEQIEAFVTGKEKRNKLLEIIGYQYVAADWGCEYVTHKDDTRVEYEGFVMKIDNDMYTMDVVFNNKSTNSFHLYNGDQKHQTIRYQLWVETTSGTTAQRTYFDVNSDQALQLQELLTS
jgi:hypothetical protein